MGWISQNSEPLCKNVVLYKLKVENIFDNIPDGEEDFIGMVCQNLLRALLREDWKNKPLVW